MIDDAIHAALKDSRYEALVACGVWMLIPASATASDLEKARSMLHLVELQRALAEPKYTTGVE